MNEARRNQHPGSELLDHGEDEAIERQLGDLADQQRPEDADAARSEDGEQGADTQADPIIPIDPFAGHRLARRLLIVAAMSEGESSSVVSSSIFVKSQHFKFGAISERQGY